MTLYKLFRVHTEYVLFLKGLQRGEKDSYTTRILLVFAMSLAVGGTSGKEPACQCRRCKRCGFDPWVGKIPWVAWQPIPVFLPGESHGRRSLVDYSP